MANAAIFNALMRPVRSVDDYLTQYDQRDAQKAQLQQNALAAMQGQQLREMQMAEIQRRAQAEQAAQQRQRGIEDAYRGAYRSPEQMAMAGGGGPTVGNAAKIGSAAPSVDQAALVRGLMKADPMAAYQMLQPKPADYKVVGDALVSVGPGGVKEAYKAQPKPAAPTEIARLTAEMAALPPGSPLRAVYEDAIRKQATHAPAPSAVSYGSPVPIMLPDGSIGYAQPGNKAGAPPQVMTGPGGKPLVKPGEAEKPLTEGQAKAVAFASRMQAADQTLAELARSGTRASIPGSMQNNSVGDVLTALAPADQQRLNQAKRDFVNATLRRESGAVISPEEFANADRQYFPQIGDSRAVIEQKAKNRRTAIEGIKADVPTGKRSEIDRISGTSGAPTGGAFEDPEKERRYQEWKRQQGQR